MRNGTSGGPQAVPVAPFSIDVEFSGDVSGFQLEKPGGRVLDVDRIVLGLKQEGRRCVAGGVQIGVVAEGEAWLLIWLRHDGGEIARVDDDCKVRARGCGVIGIDVGVETLAESGAERRSEMSAGREAENADTVRVDVKVRGVTADESKGPLRIFKGSVRFRVGAGIRDTVLEHHAGDALAVQPLANFRAFEIDSKDGVAATRKDDDGGSSRIRGGLIDREGRNGDMAEANDRSTRDKIIFRSCGIGFWRG